MINLSETHKAALRYASNPSNWDLMFSCSDNKRVGALSQLVCMRSPYLEDLVKNSNPTQLTSPITATLSSSGSNLPKDVGEDHVTMSDEVKGERERTRETVSDADDASSASALQPSVASQAFHIEPNQIMKIVKVPLESEPMREVLYFLYTDAVSISFDEAAPDEGSGNDRVGAGNHSKYAQKPLNAIIVNDQNVIQSRKGDKDLKINETIGNIVRVASASHRFHLPPLAEHMENLLLERPEIHPCYAFEEARTVQGGNKYRIGENGGTELKPLIFRLTKKIRSNPAYWLLGESNKEISESIIKNDEADGNLEETPGILHLSLESLQYLFPSMKPCLQFRCVERWIRGYTSDVDDSNPYRDEDLDDPIARANAAKSLLDQIDLTKMDPRFLQETVRPSGLISMERLFDALFQQMANGKSFKANKTGKKSKTGRASSKSKTGSPSKNAGGSSTKKSLKRSEETRSEIEVSDTASVATVPTSPSSKKRKQSSQSLACVTPTVTKKTKSNEKKDVTVESEDEDQLESVHVTEDVGDNDQIDEDSASEDGDDAET